MARIFNLADRPVAGDIALVQRGTCPYVQKAATAQEAGAAGLILYNEGNSPDRLEVPGNLPLGAEGIHIPGVGTSFGRAGVL